MAPRLLTALTAASALLLLAACSTPSDEGSPAAPSSAPPTSAPSSPSAEAVAFSVPRSCEDMLPEERLAAFAAQGLVLLGGPGGLYGTDYFPDQTPEESLGGLTCVWGIDEDVRSVVAVSVAPLASADRDAVIRSLTEQGLNEQIEGDTAVYAQLGDEVSSAAQLNVLRGDSWISVLPAAGGDAVFQSAVDIAEDAAVRAYASD